MIRRIARLAIGIVLSVLPAIAVACGGGASPSPSPSPTLPTATPIGLLPATVHPGDPPVYSDALARFQNYLDMWMEGNAASKNAMLEPPTQPNSVSDQQLLGGAIISYQPEQHISDNEFTLLITFELHLPASNESAWGEGPNSRFITFERADASSPFLMKFATSPPFAAD